MKQPRCNVRSSTTDRPTPRTGKPAADNKLGNPLNKLTLIYIPTAIAYVLLATNLLTRGAPEGASANPDLAPAPTAQEQVVAPADSSVPVAPAASSPADANSSIQTSQAPAIDQLLASSSTSETPAAVESSPQAAAPAASATPAQADAPTAAASSQSSRPIVSGPFHPAAVARSEPPKTEPAPAPMAQHVPASPAVAPVQAPVPVSQPRSVAVAPVSPAPSTPITAAPATPPQPGPVAARSVNELKQQNSAVLYASRSANLLAQEAAPAATPAAPPSPEVIQDLKNRLNNIRPREDTFGNIYEGSPALSVANPVGFGADNFTVFASGTYQPETRYSNEDDGALGVGVGLGDARKAVGVELSYTLASFGRNRDFGTGGFNLKVHHQFSEDLAAAIGWNGFITIGDGPNDDFKDSVYGVVTKIFRTRPSLDDPFSRVAVTAGLGNGQFRLEDDVADDNKTVNVFGGVAVRVVRPVSAIVEWTGQDLAVGLSIVPFKNQSFVITPAVRDIAGAGDGARFVLGVGFAYQF